MSGASALALRPAAGDGEPAVLLHGFGADRWTWMANQAALGAVAKPWLADLPGHGASTTEVEDASLPALAGAVLAALDAHDLARVHLVGHSLGGALAMLLAAAEPERVASLTLIAPAGLGGPVDADFLAGFPELDDAAAAEALLRRLVVRPRLVNQQMVAHVLETLEVPGRRAALRRIAESLALGADAIADAAAEIGRSALPRLTVWGEADAISPPDPARLRSFGGDVLVLPETGHLPHVEAAPRFNRAAGAFIAGLRGG